MSDEVQDLINIIYEKNTSNQVQNTSEKILRKSSKAKYQIFDELEFTRGREVLGEIIVHGMIASGGTDIDWLIEHFQMYQDALNAKKDRKNQEEYFILYKDQNNEFCCR